MLNRLREKITAVLVLAFVFGIFASGCSLIEKSPEAIKKQNVAKVGDEYITRAELDEMFSPLIEQIKANPDYGESYLNSSEGKEAIASQKMDFLHSLVENKLFEQKARELQLFKDEIEIEAEVKKQVDSLIEFYKSEEELNKKIEESKMTKDLFMKFLRAQVISNKVYEYLVKDLSVGDDEIQKFYDENKAYMTEKPNTLEVSHILVNTLDEAKEIKSQLDDGADFATLAKEKSIEPAAKETGGSLGEIEYYDLNYDPIFVDAAMKLKEGETSDPVETQFGFHIIRVTKKTEYPIQPLDKVKDQIKEQILTSKESQKYNEAVDEWMSSAGVKIYEKNVNNEK